MGHRERNWDGWTVIVTGAGTGLGRAVATDIAAAGANVILCGRRADKVEAAAADIREAGGTALAVQADVSREEDVRRLVAAALETFGRIDALINNAAVFEPGQVIGTPLAQWNEQIAVNLTGAFLATREVLPVMRRQQRGRIVNITSALAAGGAGSSAAYSASKAGLESLTRTTAEEEGYHHILVNLYDPGMIKTEMRATGKDPARVSSEIAALAAPDVRFSSRLVGAGWLLGD
ncbi:MULTISPECIES: SDR family NAD(P)-dependent oxidoreductase [Paenibacillus]|uniref:SDR family NAD(P)-dependent oxidoreductase n=1 Tax=Paenibacillus TaxID=44249 RepID=UPI0022B93BB5|nr:SDR family oxidoreductase [Paenibacillus caseinilyticus]MCZ8519399.1 SDR family NAD(P)-dependent oxidoreductase [Paenibacillus caseinilyticus]